MSVAEPEVRLERVRAADPDRLEALLVGAGPHLEAVLDVGSTPSGDLLLVLPAPAARLTDLLEVPGWPTEGEAVTVLVPLATALQRLHAAGVACGAAGAESVVLDADGSPAWRLPASPVLERRAGPAAFAAAVAADRTRFAGLAAAVVERAGGRLSATTDLAELVDALFSVADPVAVRLRPDPPLPGVGTPARLVEPSTDPVPAGGSARLAGAALRSWWQRAARAAATVRRRVWFAAGAVGCGLLAAVLLLPSGGAGASSGARQPGPVRTTPASRASAAPAPSPTVVAPRSVGGSAAVSLLLTARAECLDTGAASCLAAIDAPGSPVLTADRAAIRAGAEGVRPADGRLRVLSSGGGTVVTAIGRVVVVAVRQQDGWRLRDVVAEPPG